MAEKLIDRAIGYFSPKLALERTKARHQLLTTSKVTTRGYNSAATGRLSSPRSGIFGSRASADTEMFGALNEVRSRSRDLVRNNPHCAKAVEALVANIIGDGIMPRPKTGDPEKDRVIKALFDDWSKASAADADGQLDFYGLQRLACRQMVESGEVLIRRRLRRAEDGYDIPLQLQLLEADFLDVYRNGPLESGSTTFMGVEIANSGPQIGKRTAYWLYQQHPGNMWFDSNKSFTSVPVPASEVLHIYEKQRTQARGMPWGQPAFETLSNLADWEQAELVRKKLEACALAFITTPSGVSAGWNQVDPFDPDAANALPPGSFDQQGNPLDRFEPGQIGILQNGESITFNQPQPVANYNEYKSSNLRSIAAGFRIPVELMSGDYSDVNFSSSRAVMEEFGKMVRAVQSSIFESMMLQPVWDWFTEAAYLAGKIDTPTVNVEWSKPRRPWTNPVDDVAAMRDAIRAGVRSPQDIIAEMGRDWRDVLDETAEYYKLCAELNVVFDNNAGAVSLKGVAQKGDPAAAKTSHSNDDVPQKKRSLADITSDLSAADEEALFLLLKRKHGRKNK